MSVTSLSQSPEYVESATIKSASDSQALTTAKLSADATETSLPPKPPATDATDDAALSRLGFPQPTINSEQNTVASSTPQTSSTSDDLYTGAPTVGKDLYNGAVDEMVDHPAEVLLSAGMGVATGALTTLAAPEVVIAAGVAGLAYGAYKVAEDAPGWINDAKVVSSPDDHTAAQEDQANSDLRSVGGAGLLTLAAGAGASVGGAVDSAIADANASRVGVCMRIEDVYDRVMPPKVAAKPATDATTAQASTSTQASPGTTGQTGMSSVQPSVSDLAQMGGGGPGRAVDAPPAATLPSTPEKNVAAVPSAGAETDGDKSPTPQERAATVNQLQNGKIDDIRTIEDNGLGKKFTVGKISGADGKDMSVIIRPIDPANTMDLSRVNQAQIQANVDQITGIPTGSPESAVREMELDGKLQTVAVQEYAGKTLGANLKEWAGSAYGNANELGMVPEEDLQNIIQSHPALKESIGKGFLQVLYQGNPDMANLSNLAIRGSQAGEQSLDAPMQIPIIDSKLNWFPGDDATNGAANPNFPPPDWGANAGYGDAKPVVELYAGKQLSDVSPALQQRAENLQSVFSSTQGRAQLLKAGLSENEIDAASARLQYLTTKGFPPLYKPFVDDEWDTISGHQLEMAGSHYAPQRNASLTLEKVLEQQKSQLEPAS